MLLPLPPVDNPQWEGIERGIKDGRFALHDDVAGRILEPTPEHHSDLSAILSVTSTTVADPDTLDWIHNRLGDGSPVVTTDGRNGYWPHMLRQHGHPVTAFDRSPPQGQWGEPRVIKSKRYNQLNQYPNATLFMAHTKHPYADACAALTQFTGRRLLMLCHRPYETMPLSNLLAGWKWCDRWVQMVNLPGVAPRAAWYFERPTEWYRINTGQVPALAGAPS